MAKSATGRKGSKGGTRHKSRFNCKRTRSKSQRPARLLTIRNCIRRPGRLSRNRTLKNAIA